MTSLLRKREKNKHANYGGDEKNRKNNPHT